MLRTSFPKLHGVGLGSTFEEAFTHCEWRSKRQPQWSKLRYLTIGLPPEHSIPADLLPRLEDTGLDHCIHLVGVNLVRPLRQQRALIDTMRRAIDHLQPSWVEEDLGLWSWEKLQLMEHMLQPIFDESTLEIAIDNVRQLVAELGRPFLVENPPVYFDLGGLDLLGFMSVLAQESRCGLVLDIGHLVGYCVVTHRDPEDYLAQWSGFDHVREVHVSGYELYPDAEAPMWYDDHGSRISAYAVNLVEQVVGRTGRPLAVTLEQEGASYRRVADHIETIHNRLFSHD